MTDGVCFITIQGQRMGCYRLGDRAAQRSLLKQVYRACQTTQAQLWERIGPRYPNHAQEGRKLIAAALRAPGSMRLHVSRFTFHASRFIVSTAVFRLK